MKKQIKLMFFLPLIATSLSGCEILKKKEEPVVVLPKYNIVWKNSDGSVLKTESVEEGKMPVAPANPTIESTAQYSFTFASWDKTIEAASKDATYTAVYTSSINSYKVTWKNYDGEVLAVEQNVPYGTIASYKGKTPEKESFFTEDGRYVTEYNFIGWNASPSAVTQDVTYVALFDSKISELVHVSYVVEGAEGYVNNNPLTFVKGSDVTFAPATKTGYEFSGWKIDGLVPVTSINDISENMTLVGSLSIVDYTVSYELSGGENSALNPTSIKYGEEFILEPATKEGYTFSHWELNGKKVTKLSEITKNVVLTAKYVANKYHVVEVYGDDISVVLDVTFDQSFKFTSISKRGYTLLGWVIEGDEVDGEGNYKFVDSNKYSYTNDIVVKPVWSDAKVYSLSYILNGGEFAQEAIVPESFTVNDLKSGSVVIPSPTKEGYTFKGFTCKGVNISTFNIDHYETVLPFHQSCENTTLVATWEANKYVVSYNLDGGSANRKITWVNGDEVEVSNVNYCVPAEFKAVSPKEGKLFAGWYLGEELYNFDAEITEDIILVAKWIDLEQGNAGVIVNGGAEEVEINGYKTKTVQFTSLVNQEVTISSSSEVALYASVLGVECADFNNAKSLDVTLEAGKVYSLVLRGQSNEKVTSSISIVSKAEHEYPAGQPVASIKEVASEIVAYDSVFVLPEDPVKDGFEFAGWFIGETEVVNNTQFKFAGDVEIVAHWIAE